MHIVTHHRTVVAVDTRTGELRQVKGRPPPVGNSLALVAIPDGDVAQLKAMAVSGRGVLIANGPLAGCEYIESVDNSSFSLRRNGAFGCAQEVSDAVIFDAPNISAWEVFQFISDDETAALTTPIQDVDAFARTIQALIREGKPICLHFGCGPRRIEGYLNVDKFQFLGYSADYFNFDFAAQAWPIPDGCVDYIYTEDFIEHIPQRDQFGFLAESFRVLKSGGYNRVNTPCLRASMANSDFTKGYSGVYFYEYDQWRHISLFTPASLQEMAAMIGYRHVFLTAKSRGTSPFAVPDFRPGGDRDDLVGNIFADLLK